MDAEIKILSLLRQRGGEGILQSEIPDLLNLSKSTVSETLSKLEEEKRVLRKRVTSKSYRVWCTEFAPEPIPGMMRIGILRASEYPVVVGAGEKIDAFIRVYESSLELTRALVSGHVDVAASPLVTQIFFGILMKNIEIFRIVAMNGSGVVFGNSESEYFGCSEFSTMEINLREYMRIRDFRGGIRYFRSPEDMVANLVELRGIAIWEPYVTILSDREVEMFSDVLGDYVCCTLAANKDFLRVNQDLFEEFLDSFDSGRKNVRKLAQLIEMDYRTVKKSISSYILDVEQRKEFAERELEFLRLGGVESILRI